LIHPDAPDPSLTLEELKQVLNSALHRNSFIFSRKHAKSRSLERHITFEDVVHICFVGKFKCNPWYENQNWKYKAVGKDLNGEQTTVLLAVDNEKYLVTVITIY